MSKPESLFDKVFKAVDELFGSEEFKKGQQDVWHSATTATTATTGTKIQFQRHDLEFVFDAAAQHPDHLVKKHVLMLRDKYLGDKK